jgi:WD40 repeat protein
MLALLFSLTLTAPGGRPGLADAPPPEPDALAPVTLPGPLPRGVRFQLGRPTDFATTVLAFSADGRTLATTTNRGFTSGLDAPVHLWDVATGRLLHTLRWHQVGVMAAAFTPDGSVLATSGIDNFLRFWDAKTGQDITRDKLPLSGHGYALSFSPDGKQLVVGSTQLELYDVATQKPIKPKPGYFAETAGHQFFHAATWSPGGKYIAAACEGPGVRIWEAATGNLVRAVPVPYTVHRTRFAFSADDKLLLISTFPTGLFAVYDVATGKELRTVGTPRNEAAPEQVQFAREKGRVAWVVQPQPNQPPTRTLAIADATGTELQRITVPAPILSHLFSPDGSRLAVGGQDGSLRVYDPDSGKLLRVLLANWSPVAFTAYTDGGATIRTVHTDGTVHDFRADTGQLRRHRTLDVTRTPHLLALSANGQFLAAAAETGEAVIWDLGTEKIVAKPTGQLFIHRERIRGFGGRPPLLPPPLNPPPPPPPPGGPGGPRPPLGGPGGPPPPPPEYDGPPQFAVAFSPDGQLLAAVTTPGDAVTIWETTTGKHRHTLTVPKGTGTLAFSIDSTHLFTGLARRTEAEPNEAALLRRYELKSGRAVQSWKPLPPIKTDNGRYAYSTAQLLLPLANQTTLAVVEVQHDTLWPPPPLAPGGPVPLIRRAQVRLIDLPGRSADRSLPVDEVPGGIGATPDGATIGYVVGPSGPQAAAQVKLVDVATGQPRSIDLPNLQPLPTAATVVFRPTGTDVLVNPGDGRLLVLANR